MEAEETELCKETGVSNTLSTLSKVFTISNEPGRELSQVMFESPGRGGNLQRIR